MLLEHRLAEFIEWMNKREVVFAGKSGARLSSTKIHELVEEYVNS